MDNGYLPLPDLKTIIGEFGEAVADASIGGTLYAEEDACDWAASLDAYYEKPQGINQALPSKAELASAMREVMTKGDSNNITTEIVDAIWKKTDFNYQYLLDLKEQGEES